VAGANSGLKEECK